MDPFTQLPLELLFSIVDELDYFGEFVLFTHASSFIFRTLGGCKRRTSLRILGTLKPSYLLNDAVAIATFPSRSAGVLPEEHDVRIWEHLQSWKKSADNGPIDLDSIDPFLAIGVASICHQFQVQFYGHLGQTMTGILSKPPDPAVDENSTLQSAPEPHCSNPDCQNDPRSCQRLESYFHLGLLDKAIHALSTDQKIDETYKWWVFDLSFHGFFRRRRLGLPPRPSKTTVDH